MRRSERLPSCVRLPLSLCCVRRARDEREEKSQSGTLSRASCMSRPTPSHVFFFFSSTAAYFACRAPQNRSSPLS